MSYTVIVSIVVVCLTIYGLIKRYETRMVLIAAGFITVISFL